MLVSTLVIEARSSFFSSVRSPVSSFDTSFDNDKRASTAKANFRHSKL